jgi:hypothetical protein
VEVLVAPTQQAWAQLAVLAVAVAVLKVARHLLVELEQQTKDLLVEWVLETVLMDMLLVVVEELVKLV